MMITRLLLALIYIQNSITMPHLAVLQLMRVIQWPRPDSDSRCVNKNVRGNKGFYSIHWIALAEYSQMSTHVHRFQSIFRFLSDFILAKLATSSIRVRTPPISDKL